MNTLIQDIDQSRQEIDNFSTAEKNAAEVFRIQFLGSKGIIKSLMGEMKNVSAERRKELGLLLNELKIQAEKKYEQLGAASEGQPETIENSLDLTLPGDPLPVGSRHPISLVRNRIVSIFQRLGFA